VIIAQRFLKFSGIGIVNTVVHVAVVVLLAELAGWDSVAANVMAFVVANTFSFWANSRWTFRSRLDVGRYGRFLTVSLAGLIVTAAVSAFAAWMGWHYLVGTLLIFFSLPALTFFAHHKWTWEEHQAGRKS
jgi:putative flippase GtrA